MKYQFECDVITNCSECPILDNDYELGGNDCLLDVKIIIRSDKRPENCPLTEVN